MLGFDSFRYLQEQADKDVIQQIQFNDLVNTRHPSVFSIKDESVLTGKEHYYNYSAQELHYTSVADADLLLEVKSGSLNLYVNLNPALLTTGNSVRIKAGRTFGAQTLEEGCKFTLATM